MAALYTAQFSALRSALRALSLYVRPPGAPAAAVGLRFVCNAAPEEKTRVTSESTEEYKFVERLIPPSRVPAAPKHAGPSPSGWTPSGRYPAASALHDPPLAHANIPVYTDVTNSSRRTTLVRRVEGDIWALEKDVKQYLKEVMGKELPTQVNEVTMTLKVKGHVDSELKEWLASKGF